MYMSLAKNVSIIVQKVFAFPSGLFFDVKEPNTFEPFQDNT